MTMLLPGIHDVRAAAHRLHGHVRETPVVRSRRHGVFLKLEHLQVTRSFKERGALNALLVNEAASRASGVIAASAGNHGQGLAYHAQRLGIAATIVMPLATPAVKVERVRGFGAHVHLHGAEFVEAHRFALDLQLQTGARFIHPYDDDAVIAGQATATLEFLRAVTDLDVLLVPVGGGGLIAGAALAIELLGARVRLVGVRHAAYPAVFEHAGAGAHRCLPTIAEGLAVSTIGRRAKELLADVLDEVIVVSEEQIARSVAELFRYENVVAEGAGAAGCAAATSARERFRDQRIGTFISGGNIDPSALESCFKRVSEGVGASHSEIGAA